MKSLTERIEYLSYVFDLLQDTNSIVEKRQIVNDIEHDCKYDFEYVVECLTGKQKFGYTYTSGYMNNGERFSEDMTVADALKYLQKPYLEGDLSSANIMRVVSMSYNHSSFFIQIVNRTLKLGIGSSLLDKDSYSAMLAKKFEGKLPYSQSGYYITEKLDGNRCIAHFENGRWVFTSRNGKEMHVNFDMSGLPTDFVYDGEVLSPQQVQLSDRIFKSITENAQIDMIKPADDAFNQTSGLINRHDVNKKLIYNIFDVQIPNEIYQNRRDFLNGLRLESKDLRILPVLALHYSQNDLNDNVVGILDKITAMGGEGLMINIGSAMYEHKRTDNLLKFKKVKTMDMTVKSTYPGTGKYDLLVGGIVVECNTDDGKHILCDVGSGLSDEQRFEWALHPELIVGKVVEIAYFSLSQNSTMRDTNTYSLRFPRLKKVRTDKQSTSEY